MATVAFMSKKAADRFRKRAGKNGYPVKVEGSRVVYKGAQVDDFLRFARIDVEHHAATAEIIESGVSK